VKLTMGLVVEAKHFEFCRRMETRRNSPRRTKAGVVASRSIGILAT